MRQSVKRRELWGRILRYLRLQRLRLLRLDAPPEVIARGMAVGVFVGLIPLLPSQSLLAIGVAFLLRASKIAAVIGTLITNPLTWVFLYILFYHIGKAILPLEIPPLDINRLDFESLVNSGWRMAVAMLTGGVVLAVPSSILAYILTLRGVRFYRIKRDLRRATSAPHKTPRA